MALCYSCDCCDEAGEGMAYADTSKLRVITNGEHSGEWWCENCYDESGMFEDHVPWHTLPAVPEHVSRYERDHMMVQGAKGEEREACARVARQFSTDPGDIADRIAQSMEIPF